MPAPPRRYTRRSPSSNGDRRLGQRTHSRRRSRPSTGSVTSRGTSKSFSLDADHPLQFAAEDDGADTGRVGARRARRLPDRRCRSGRSAAADPAALGHGDAAADMDLHGILAPTPKSATDSAASGRSTTSTPTPRPKRSRRSSLSRRSGRRSTTSSPTHRRQVSRDTQLNPPCTPLWWCGAGHAGLGHEPPPHASAGSITWSSSAARWRTRGGPSGGTRCACSRRTG